MDSANMQGYHQDVYELEDRYWWFKAKRDFLLDNIKMITAQSDRRDLSLLDCGCGTGASLSQMRNVTSCVAIDGYFESLKFCRMRNLDNLINADLEHLPFKKGTFDIVSAMDVLEHVDSDSSALNEIFRIIKDGGILILHVPALMFLWSDHDIAVGHRRRYTINQLSGILNDAGFKVRFIRYRLFSFFLLGVIRKYSIKLKRLLNKNYQIKAQRPKVNNVINNILYRILRLEDGVLKFVRFPFGMSIFCIAEKKGKE